MDQQNYNCMNAQMVLQWATWPLIKIFQTKFGEYLKRKFLKIDRASSNLSIS